MTFSLAKTIRLKVAIAPFVAEELIERFTAACNYVSRNLDRVKRKGNAAELQKEFYHEIRKKYELPAQYTCSVFRVVSGKVKTNPKTAPVFKREFPSLQQGRDFSFTKKGLSILTLHGRLKCNYTCDQKQFEELNSNWKQGGAKLVVTRKGVYLYITYTRKQEQLPATDVLGIDLGIVNTAVVSNGKAVRFFKNSKYKSQRKHIQEKRSEVQSRKTQRNTHSLRLFQKRLSGKEARLTRNEMHIVSKNIVRYALKFGTPRIAVEDLKGIKKCGINHGWSFFMLQTFLTYKANALGMEVEKVNRAYSSQKCSKCGHTEKANRQGRDTFLCKSCKYTVNADVNASFNLRMLSIVQRNSSLESGCNSTTLISAETLEKSKELGVTSQRALAVGS